MSKFFVGEILIDTNTNQHGKDKKTGEQGDCSNCCIIEKSLIYTPADTL